MDYTPNSHRSKEAQKAAPTEKTEKKVQKVVAGTVKTKKKNELTKIADIFLPEDVADVKSYILMDVLIPAAKKLIDDVVTGGIHMWLYGSSGRNRSNTSSSYVSYRNYSDNRDTRPRASESRSGFNYDDIILETRGDAEMLLSQMDDMIERYDQVSVADMYDAVDLSCPYTYNHYGWTNLGTATTVRTRDGWTLKLPRAVPLK